MTAVLHIEQAGLMTTVQDLGRFGAQALGVPVSGALDSIALRLANALVGNVEGMAGLEVRLLGPTIRVVNTAVRVALCGTKTPLEVSSPNPHTIPPGQSETLPVDTVFRVGATPDTGVCYLAVAGGFDLRAQP